MRRSLRIRRELVAARKIWPQAVHGIQSDQLELLLKTYRFSVGRGDLQILGGSWYVTHMGLLGVAARRRCCGIHTEAVEEFCEKTACRWTFKAVVYKSSNCKGFVGYGDADPSNVSPLVHGAEMRVAETRAVNRALHKAYGIGICSVEEIGSFAEPIPSSRESKKLLPQPVNGKNESSAQRSQLVAPSVTLPSQECAEFFDKDPPGWFICEKKMIGTRQRNKSRVWNLCS